MSKKIHKGQIFGVWKLKKHLGNGGNGDVWLAVNSENQEVAIKLLREVKRKTYARFIDEVNVINANSDVDGILPILDSYLPDNLENEIPWYVMPVAEPLEKYLDGKHFEDIVVAISNVAKTLSELHHRNISHRDIKPENLLVREGKACLADFGLVDYPNKTELTSSGEAIGAKWTMAPEMRREGSKADGKPADVYSLAKTLWILITKNKKGFDGQYNPVSANGLSRLKLIEKGEDGVQYFDETYRRAAFIKPLEDLLHSGTADAPLERPTIQDFYKTLSWWLTAHKDLDARNPVEWQTLQGQLFPTIMPQRAIWENTKDIADILNLIGSIAALNQMFYPYGGTSDLEGAKLGLEPDTIELVIDFNWIDLIKPKRLIFESFDSDAQWNYFRLETAILDPIGVGEVYLERREDLVEITPLNYINFSNQGESLPENSRIVTRHLKGDFVIFSKRSFYNLANTTDDGRHNQMTTDQFREYIFQKVKAAQEILTDEKIAKLAVEKNMSMNDVLNIYFDKDFSKDHKMRFRDRSFDEIED